MMEQNGNLGNIPNIGTSQIWMSPNQWGKTFDKPDVAMFDNAPSDVSLGSFFGKIFIFRYIFFWFLRFIIFSIIIFSDWILIV